MCSQSQAFTESEWEGDGFRSPEIMFRVVPERKGKLAAPSKIRRLVKTHDATERFASQDKGTVSSTSQSAQVSRPRTALPSPFGASAAQLAVREEQRIRPPRPRSQNDVALIVNSPVVRGGGGVRVGSSLSCARLDPHLAFSSLVVREFRNRPRVSRSPRATGP